MVKLLKKVLIAKEGVDDPRLLFFMAFIQ